MTEELVSPIEVRSRVGLAHRWQMECRFNPRGLRACEKCTPDLCARSLNPTGRYSGAMKKP